MTQIFLGILSGTSMDAIDVAAIDFDHPPFKLLGTHSEPYPLPLYHALHELGKPGYDEINRLGQLDRQVGRLFANACNALLHKLNLPREKVIAIGSHGQNIRHQPNLTDAYTWQIGDPNTIAELTGITTIADFRRRDIACGGQGAPLTPAFHHFAFHSSERNRVIVNIGGIANVTFLSKDPSLPALGFDTGPGNTLLDHWIKHSLGMTYDVDGNWGKQGTPHLGLLNKLLSDDYFQLPPPKSTGTEYFNLVWLAANMNHLNVAAHDMQSTLAELTAHTIANGVMYHEDWAAADILVCGGGVHNKDLMTRIRNKLTAGFSLYSTGDFGVDPNWVEAIAFAWLARQTLKGLPGNLPAVTGARHGTVLGGIFKGNVAFP